jgi:hypothetical protein
LTQLRQYTIILHVDVSVSQYFFLTIHYQLISFSDNPDCSGTEHVEVPLTTFFQQVYDDEPNFSNGTEIISQTIDNVSQTIDLVSQTVEQVSNQTEKQNPESTGGSSLYLLFLIIGVVVVLAIAGVIGTAAYMYIQKRKNYEVFIEEMNELDSPKELKSEDLFTLDEEEPKSEDNETDVDKTLSSGDDV